MVFKMSVNEIHFSASFAITLNLLPFKAILLNHTPADLPQMGSELGCTVRECTGHSDPGTGPVKVGAVTSAPYSNAAVAW